MRLNRSRVRRHLLGSDNLDDLLLALCNHYAPFVILFVLQQTDIEQPEFIAVRIVSGGVVSRYALEADAIEDGLCGATFQTQYFLS